MKPSHIAEEDITPLLSVLKAHYQSLVSARSDELVLRQYASLLRTLATNSFNRSDDRDLVRVPRAARTRPVPTINQDAVQNASLDDLEKIVSDPKTPRKDLEFIAIQRFSVPRGSMRKFTNREMLADKLRTLIGNERTHETIRAVASEH